MRKYYNEIILIIVSIFCIIWTVYADAKNIKVMVIDTGVDKSHQEIFEKVKEEWNFHYIDDNGHGTAIAGLVIRDTCDEVELISCKYYGFTGYLKDSESSEKGTNRCFQYALDQNVDYVNYSSVGIDPDVEEYKLIKQLTDKGVIVITSTGNQNTNLTPMQPCAHAFPACYLTKNMFIVGNITKEGRKAYTSNFANVPQMRWEIGVNVSVLAPRNGYITMSGTSMSTAIYTNKLLKQACWELHK